MKKILAILLFSFIGFSAVHAQLRKVPAEVTNAFKDKYASAENVEWKDKLTAFQAEFTLDGKSMTASFSDDGTWKSSETNLGMADLPASVADGFKKSKYADWQTGDKVVQISESGKPVMFRVYVKKSDVQQKYLFFNESGKLEKESVTI